ncbi:MAG: hypothetical protein QOH04_477 [Sphingomonadales bacterium]|jgi:hypothetical protein|nr:hypothetical protein [Sphingomonadales bacterium]
MDGTGDWRGGQRRIDDAAKAAFLAALRGGARREDAAAAAGFSLMGFYGARARDPVFKADWTEALAAPPAAARRVRAYEERGEVRIAPANRRLFQRRRRRNVRFDARAQALYLAHFAATGDSRAAAAAAGVHISTVRLHRRNDPAFREADEQALAEAYVFLEAESVRQRLAAQKQLRAAIEQASPNPPPRLIAEFDAEFDRTMALLARFDRKPRSPDRHGPRGPWTFEKAILALEKRLRGLGLRTVPPAEGEG